MSYKSEIQANTERMNRKKKAAFLAVKITSAVLSVMMIVSTALVIIDSLNGDLGKRTEQTEDAPSLIQATQGKSVKVYAGETLSYKSLVEYPAGYELDYDSNADLSKVGKYTVTYKLLKEGKVVETYKITIIVEERDVDREELMALVEKKAAALGITKEMSKIEQVRKISDYVKCPGKDVDERTIRFDDKVHHTATIDPERKQWETLWVKEAMIALEKGVGDCYAYYSVSKAFFEYFGIENVGIQRATGSGHNGTHFWSIVNIGTKEDPKWYYYDATRLAGKFAEDNSSNSCLITLSKLESYLTSGGDSGFYYFDPTQYTTAETKPLS